MSFHPNDVSRRSRAATILSVVAVAILTSAFFRAQILRNQQWVLQSEQNRLREVPIPAPRGIIYDRKGKVIAENIVGYSVSVLAQAEDSLRGTLRRLAGTIQLSPQQVEAAIRRYRREPTRPTVILSDAPFDVVSVLEEHRVDFPSLIIQSAPKRFYPESEAVASFVGYVSEINDRELAMPRFASYKMGHHVGKQGLEREYEAVLHGQEGRRYVEVDALGRVVREEGTHQLEPQVGGSLQTNIDLDLQLYVAQLFDTLSGGAVAMDPKTGEVLAIHSAPSFDPNRFIGGVSVAYYDSLRTNVKRPLYNKALQGQYPPGSAWKLATAVLALQENLITTETRMPQPCGGYYFLGNRAWRCWRKDGHGSLTLTGAIAQSCDVYFYQLGLKLGLARMVAGGVQLGFNQRTGIDVPEETRSLFPDRIQYFNQKYGARGWTAGAVVMNLSIGQGENAQTVVNMARFYSALATDGYAAKPEIVRRRPEREKIMNLTTQQLDDLRRAMVGVVSAGGTAASAALTGATLAGKTGTAQTVGLRHGTLCDHAWFVGFAPVEDPRIVVSVMIECGEHGYLSARMARDIIARYLGVELNALMQTEG